MGFWKKHFGKTSGAVKAAWGKITGDIDAQTDLKDKLDGKADIANTYTKAETDEEITNAQLATQQWLPAVDTKAFVIFIKERIFYKFDCYVYIGFFFLVSL
ncbi:MAG: hypothetical protein LBV16_06990 [Elusimicrobiota bacterium]|jgi:uncharacterized protein YjbJ (UPF0337 family)|nr:hypothetical protein [Elusimicrobiota bacterium]